MDHFPQSGRFAGRDHRARAFLVFKFTLLNFLHKKGRIIRVDRVTNFYFSSRKTTKIKIGVLFPLGRGEKGKN